MLDNRFKHYNTKKMPEVQKEKPQDIREQYKNRRYTQEEQDQQAQKYDEEYYPEPEDDYQDQDQYQDDEYPDDGYDDAYYDDAYDDRPIKKDPNRQYGPRSDYRQPASKTAFTALYIGLLVIAIAICITVFVLVFQWVRNQGGGPNLLDRENPISNDNNNEDDEENGAYGIRVNIENMSAMITGISIEPRGLVLLDLDNLLTNDIPLYQDTEILDRYDNNMTFSNLRIGQLVNISYDATELEILTIQENPDAWERGERTNVNVDVDNRRIFAGVESFDFNNQTLVLHRGEPFPIEQIGPGDSITIIGIRTTAWVIQIDASTGSVEVLGADNIINGRITIGNLHPLFLSEISQPIDVPEGQHRIVIEGDNINTFSDDIMVIQGQTMPLNLGNIEITRAALSINVTPSTANIFVNGDSFSSNPTLLPFGEHTIRVEHEGYEGEERTITLEEPTTTISFTLEAEEVEEEILTGTAVIFTTPSGATVYVDGQQAGVAMPNVVLELDPGTYSITARMAGYLDHAIVVTLTAGQEVTQSISLQPIPVVPEPTPTPTPPTTPADTGSDTGFGIPAPPPPSTPAP